MTTWEWNAELDPDDTARADRLIFFAIEAGKGTWTLSENQTEQPTTSRSQIQRLIDEGSVTLNGKTLKSNTKLKTGERVRIEFPPPRPMELVPEDRPIDILFQDAHLLVVNKPPGLTVHPSTTQMDGTLVHALLHHVKDLSGIGGVMRPGIVHRIDKDTSGALVITKTDAAHQALAETFSKHAIERKYWALCYGSPKITDRSGELRIESLIARSDSDRKKMSMQVKEGKTAITYIKTLEEFTDGKKSSPYASLIEARLETGRTHQVRVHLTGLGHSLLGDPVYGTPSDRATKWLALPPTVRSVVKHLPGQALHARILGFEHPITHEKLHFEAEPPAEFLAVLNALRQQQRQ